MRQQQTGIALITVLLILSLATVAAMAMTARQHLDIRRTSNLLSTEQGYMALLALEEAARVGLAEDAKNNTTDSFNDLWASLDQASQGLPSLGPFSVKALAAEDLQGRFNMTNLLDVAGQGVDQNQYQNFMRLLGTLDLPAFLADAAVDWMDQDGTPLNSGAEDSAYYGLEKPYITPNLRMASASELFRLNGVNLTGIHDSNDNHLRYREGICSILIGDEFLCQKDPPTDQPQGATPKAKATGRLLVALPEKTPINVNTVASPAIYVMLTRGRLSMADAESIYSEIQPKQGGSMGLPMAAKAADPAFKDANSFWGHSKIAALKVPDAERVEVGVSSNYFLFHAEVFDQNNSDFVVYLTTILHRTTTQNGQAVEVVHRSFSKSGEI